MGERICPLARPGEFGHFKKWVWVVGLDFILTQNVWTKDRGDSNAPKGIEVLFFRSDWAGKIDSHLPSMSKCNGDSSFRRKFLRPQPVRDPTPPRPNPEFGICMEESTQDTWVIWDPVYPSPCHVCGYDAFRM